MEDLKEIEIQVKDYADAQNLFDALKAVYNAAQIFIGARTDRDQFETRKNLRSVLENAEETIYKYIPKNNV